MRDKVAMHFPRILYIQTPTFAPCIVVHFFMFIR